MSYYSSPLIIHNHSTIENNSIDTITLKFSISFNKNKLYLNNSLVKQVLKSPAVKKFIKKECNNFFLANENYLNEKIKHIINIRTFPRAEISVIGKYFFITVYCSKKQTLDDCLKAIKNALEENKTVEELLKGE